jgi:hypothetical protein
MIFSQQNACNNTHNFVHILLITLCYTSAVHSAPEDYVIVYDVTSTFQVNQQTIRREVPGTINGIAYTLSKWTTKPADAIENDFRNLLASLGNQHGSPESLARDPEGRVLSDILCQWLLGLQSGPNVAQCISNYAEYNIFKDIAKTIFNGNIVAKHTNVIPNAAACIQQCAQVVGGNKLYLIGNWDPASYSALSRLPQASCIFSIIPAANHLVSGFIRMLMPRQAEAIFNRVAKTANVAVNHIIFVSNMPYHLFAARNLGIHAVTLGDVTATMQTIQAILNS